MTDRPTTSKLTCHFHPDRVAGVRCQRCDKPICPACMHQASVGFHCPECVSRSRQRVYAGEQVFRNTGSQPVVTIALIAVNVAVWFASLASGDTAGGGVAPDGLLIEGGLNAGLISFNDEYYRIVTAGFLHFGLWHIAINMFMLYLIGMQVEPALGRARFVLLYMVSLLAGSLGALALSPDALTAGASGAIYGLFGYVAVHRWSAGGRWWESGIGTLIIINLFFAFVDVNISVGGHLAGLAGGVIAGLVLVDLPRRVRMPRLVPELLVVAMGVALFFGSIGVADMRAPGF